MKKIKKKKKAFIGAILMGVGALAGGISSAIKARKQANADQRNYELQQGKIYANEAQNLANASTQEMNDRGYIDAMKRRISFKMGGNYKPRLKQKAKEGGYFENMSGGDIASNVLSGASGLISGAFDIATAAQKQKEYRLHNNTPINSAPAKILQNKSIPGSINQMEIDRITRARVNRAAEEINQYPYNQYNTLYDNQAPIPRYNQNTNPILNNMLRCGGKRIKQKNLNRFK